MSRQLIDLPRMSGTELEELLDDLALTLNAEKGYRVSDSTDDPALRLLPKGAKGERILVRAMGSNRVALAHVGYWTFRSRTPRLGVFTAVMEDGKTSQSPDASLVLKTARDSLAAFRDMRQQLSPGDLESRAVQLSYTDVSGALAALKGLGVSTFSKGGTIPPEIQFKDLPMVVELQSPEATSMGVVGKGSVSKNKFGSAAMPGQATELSAETVASPTSRLMVMFHPAHSEQYSRVTKLLNEVIDVPARQVFVEGLVMEIGSSALDELGIQWEFREGKWNLMLGALQPGQLTGGGGSTLTGSGTRSANLSTELAAQLRALVVEGKGRILSRPSVLTLNGRQASIRIGDDIPIATSQEGIGGNANKIAFDFDYLNIGIVLNIRPRISRDGREISLMVDTIVSDEVPGRGLQIRDAQGALLASAPRLISRRVQTYARIQNNTPFVLGGLVSRQNVTVESKVPVLGDIPYLGRLFRSEAIREDRDEVIIVLTPYILPEEVHLSRVLPKGEHLDSTDSVLFRSTYQIRAEDIVDFGFLYKNKRFDTYRRLAERVVSENVNLSGQNPFSEFTDGVVPGSGPIVHEILFNTLQRNRAGDAIPLERILTLTSLQFAGYETRYLTNILQIRREGDETKSFFTDQPGKAIALTFADLHDVSGPRGLISDPVPEMEIVDCPDRKAWQRLLWEMNQPKDDGSVRHTILLQSEEDLMRLRNAVLLKKVLEYNGARDRVEILKFIPGRIIQVPRIPPDQPQLLDANIARYFFHSQHFYAQAIKDVEAALRRLDGELRKPEIRPLLGGETPPKLVDE